MTFAHSSIVITATAYMEGKYLQVTLNSLMWTASTDASNVTVSVTIDTITDPNLQRMWESYAIEAMSDPGTLTQVLNNVQGILNSQETLDNFAAIINNALKQVIKTEMFAEELEKADPAIQAMHAARSNAAP